MSHICVFHFNYEVSLESRRMLKCAQGFLSNVNSSNQSGSLPQSIDIHLGESLSPLTALRHTAVLPGVPDLQVLDTYRRTSSIKSGVNTRTGAVTPIP